MMYGHVRHSAANWVGHLNVLRGHPGSSAVEHVSRATSPPLPVRLAVAARADREIGDWTSRENLGLDWREAGFLLRAGGRYLMAMASTPDSGAFLLPVSGEHLATGGRSPLPASRAMMANFCPSEAREGAR